ncbi:hypothetical protein YC2023_116291 [Brassica napus]
MATIVPRFVVFDREMSKHTEQEADTLALDELHFCYLVTITLNGSKTLNLLQISDGEGQELSRCLEELAGKDYVFQIRIFKNTCTTVSQSCTSNPTAVVDGEDGQLTASASNTVEVAKIAMGVDCRERKQPQNAPVNDSFKSIILSTPLTFHVF